MRPLTVVLVAYLALVGYGTLGPSPGDEIALLERGVRWAGGGVDRIVEGPSADPSAGSGVDWLEGVDAEDVGNLLMFVPLGLLVPLLWPDRHRWTVPAGLALSASIELLQLAVLTHRTAEWSDLSWNTLGAATGYGLWWVSRIVTTRGGHVRQAGGGDRPS